MNRTDAISFVTSEIKGRLRFLRDVEFGDWVRAVERVEKQVAQNTITQIIDSGQRLTLPDFIRRLAQPKPGVGTAPPEPELLCHLQGQNTGNKQAVYLPIGDFTREQRETSAAETAEHFARVYGEPCTILWPPAKPSGETL